MKCSLYTFNFGTFPFMLLRHEVMAAQKSMLFCTINNIVLKLLVTNKVGYNTWS